MKKVRVRLTPGFTRYVKCSIRGVQASVTLESFQADKDAISYVININGHPYNGTHGTPIDLPNHLGWLTLATPIICHKAAEGYKYDFIFCIPDSILKTI